MTEPLTAGMVIIKMAELAQEHGELEVLLEGCDCVGKCIGVAVEEDPWDRDRKVIMLLRTND